MGGGHRFFMSSPTADRRLIRILLSVSSKLKYPVAMCDISQAFLQADVLPMAGRFYAAPPPCVQISSTEWDGRLLEQPPPVRRRSTRFIFSM